MYIALTSLIGLLPVWEDAVYIYAFVYDAFLYGDSPISKHFGDFIWSIVPTL